MNALQKLDPDRNILIGDDDKYGRNDVMIKEILRKPYGFDESNDYYYVLSGGEKQPGCMKW